MKRGAKRGCLSAQGRATERRCPRARPAPRCLMHLNQSSSAWRSMPRVQSTARRRPAARSGTRRGAASCRRARGRRRRPAAAGAWRTGSGRRRTRTRAGCPPPRPRRRRGSPPRRGGVARRSCGRCGRRRRAPFLFVGAALGCVPPLLAVIYPRESTRESGFSGEWQSSLVCRHASSDLRLD